jgi:fumarate hydratase subunit alpha
MVGWCKRLRGRLRAQSRGPTLSSGGCRGGLGGNFEQSALLAKKALLRPLDARHPEPFWAEVEAELLARINRLGIGPQGLGGNTTAFNVSILYKPCHIASMPVAVNIDCHCHRHATALIE